LNEKEACELWVRRDFSMIPVSLIEKAYESNYFEDIEILAPTLDDYREEYKKDNEYCESDCDECCSDDCLISYEEHYPKIPMWGWVFVPDDPCDHEWLRKYPGIAADCGFIVYETEEIGVYLGVNGAGYDFYESHWIPLYRARGLKWHDNDGGDGGE